MPSLGIIVKGISPCLCIVPRNLRISIVSSNAKSKDFSFLFVLPAKNVVESKVLPTPVAPDTKTIESIQKHTEV